VVSEADLIASQDVPTSGWRVIQGSSGKKRQNSLVNAVVCRSGCRSRPPVLRLLMESPFVSVDQPGEPDL